MAITLTAPRTVPGSQVLAYGAARGDLVVPNDDLVGPIDSSDEWIRQRTGIVTRTRASAEVGVKDLSLTAAKEAIERSGIALETLDAIIVSTISFPYPTPSLATLLAGELGRSDVIAYDISAACAGFAYGIGQADSLIRSGAARNVLVIGAEKLSDFVSPTDRSISFLLGDGAGAAVVGPSDTPRIGPTVWGSDGDHWDTIRMTGSSIDFRDGKAEWPTLEQDGRTVFRWAVWHTAKKIREMLELSGIGIEDVDVFVPHQANMRIIDELAKQLKLPEDVVIGRDIAETGNTSAASIPLATHRLLEEGAAKSGDVLVQFGFGAGLAYAGQVLVLP
ncbi:MULTISPECIES: beta-ketoacyl-ACP synthase III [Brachybacterium]|uniref:beta-ketoacyl-ACP synthase III n=1 Tax=Brachybacterium TaxID=43668 RepID=UPI0006B60D9B|nr:MULTISPECIES: beta-ketoacyl-ACP synthase III [Brachybacterium]MCZ4324744.1 ketoacyl-ACP synthase III [Brachybacterium paraconglomeratum]GAP77262.1 3-oxoacyl-[acyl-carrier-protein] synthase, KASIII [Brachybacterium sp. SW0106-09]